VIVTVDDQLTHGEDGEGSVAPATEGGAPENLGGAPAGAAEGGAPGPGSSPATIGGAPSSEGGEDGAGLLFPLPGGGNLEDAEDLEDSVDPEDYEEEVSEDLGSNGPSDPNIIQGGSSCQVLVSDFELCKWGPSCATILREQFSHCDYGCATCTLHGSHGEESVDVVEVDQVVQVGQEAGGAVPPPISAITADPDDGDFVGQVDGNTVWQLLASVQREDFIRPPSFSRPPTSPVLAEEEDEDDGPWTWETDGPGCIAVGGKAAGSQCRFPFTYEGVVYKGCAYHPGGSFAPVPPGSLGWCSTKRDINGIHVNGPSGNPWKYVGFCDNSCPSA